MKTIRLKVHVALILGFALVGPAVVRSENSPSNAAAANPADKPVDPALLQVEEDPKLPRVLLIGDSITMGYTPALRELLKGKANVQHPTQNCGPSSRIVSNLDQYLGKKPWDVIQLNCGIHDVTYMNEDRKLTTPKDGGRPQVSLDEYRTNLEQIVARLKKTGAKLIWCTTTPISEPAPYRIAGDVDRYNDVALQIMHNHGIQITDLHGEVLKHGAPKWDAGGVHFTPDGYQDLAAWAAPAIQNALPQSRPGNR
jgi:acyl-CoA thioesterase-1